MADNNYAGISDATTWNFTTEDNTTPTVSINFSDATLTDADLEQTITLLYDEAMNNGIDPTITITGLTSIIHCLIIQ